VQGKIVMFFVVAEDAKAERQTVGLYPVTKEGQPKSCMKTAEGLLISNAVSKCRFPCRNVTEDRRR
jgi:hypothetical protein